jgi:hypothetical protein
MDSLEGRDPMGQAIYDYHFKGIRNQKIKVFSSVSEGDVIPVSYLFRKLQQMPTIEQKALDLCQGRVLDVGAGSGCHSLVLQSRRLDVMAMEPSLLSYKVLLDRGIKKTSPSWFANHNIAPYDTILMLMNGIGIVGEISLLPSFFDKCRQLLAPGGKVILDSSDLVYLFTDDDEGYGMEMDWDSGYYGEVSYQMEYAGITGEKFKWLFIDYESLAHAANKHGFACEKVMEDSHFGFLAQLQDKGL